MKASRLTWLLVIPGAVATAIWFMFFHNTWSWHQKLTVRIETPNGELVASSVTRASLSHNSFVPGSPGGRASGGLRGEAVVMDLGNGRYLFALLKLASGGGFRSLAQYVVLEDSERRLELAKRGELFEQVGRKGVVPSKHLPLFVTFTNINNPASVKKVDPNNLAAVFGPGYRTKSVTLEITDEPLTEGKIEKVLGWLSEYPELGLCKPTGRANNIPFCRRVKHGSFTRR